MTQGIRTYVVECYSPAIDRRAVESTARRAQATAVELQRQGRRVHYLGAILVPGDEAVFYLFAADSDGVVREASARAGVEFERAVESIPIGLSALTGTSSVSQETVAHPAPDPASEEGEPRPRLAGLKGVHRPLTGRLQGPKST